MAQKNETSVVDNASADAIRDRLSRAVLPPDSLSNRRIEVMTRPVTGERGRLIR
ncbi:MAG TPA: hypothetical protein VFH13_00500 [Gemmatimonadaceae bacterium]|jgi:hypothetical protein|nr:hypothetical protein [Gemmatimonadaceae bacterium]